MVAAPPTLHHNVGSCSVCSSTTSEGVIYCVTILCEDFLCCLPPAFFQEHYRIDFSSITLILSSSDTGEFSIDLADVSLLHQGRHCDPPQGRCKDPRASVLAYGCRRPDASRIIYFMNDQFSTLRLWTTNSMPVRGLVILPSTVV